VCGGGLFFMASPCASAVSISVLCLFCSWFVFWRVSGEGSVVVASSVSSFPVFLPWFDACEWFCRLSSPLLMCC